MFEYFCPFLSLTIIAGQRNFPVLQIGHMTEVQRPEMVLIFLLQYL